MIKNEAQRKYYTKNKERILKRSREYKNNPDVKERDALHKKEEHKNNPAKSMYRNAKARAIKMKLDFYITIDDIHIPEVCPYLGIKLIPGTYKERGVGAAPTIDRIDSSKGYTPENIEVISDLANRMKQNASKEQLITFAKSVLFRFDHRH